MTAVVIPLHAAGAPARMVSRPRLPRRWWLRLPWWWRARLRARLVLAEAERDRYRDDCARAYRVLREISAWYQPEVSHA